MKKAIASAGLLAIGTIGAQTIHAQFAAGPEKPWSISGTLRGFYDDNINTQPNGPGRVSSTGFEIRPTGSLEFDLGPTTLRASYTYALLYYTEREPNKIDQDHDFELFMNHNFNERYTLDFTESFVVAQEPDVLAPGTQSLFLRANGSNIRNTGLLNFHAGITRLFGIVLGYSNTWYDYSENVGNNLPTGSPLLQLCSTVLSRQSLWIQLGKSGSKPPAFLDISLAGWIILAMDPFSHLKALRSPLFLPLFRTIIRIMFMWARTQPFGRI